LSVPVGGLLFWVCTPCVHPFAYQPSGSNPPPLHPVHTLCSSYCLFQFCGCNRATFLFILWYYGCYA
ncbi:hypothetical protein U1Q18_011558, partial [Sarracenia purpurea var. burkii]